MIELYRKTNEFNTPLNDAYYSDINKDIQEEINAAIDEIVFIQRLISPDMPTLESLQRDELGRVVVDITNPHKLVNMAYFTQSAEHFRKHGAYTLFPKNNHPKSPYYLYWKEEKRRIKEGLIREDGEWIPGNLYWYWNFCPIMKTRKLGTGKRSERIHDFGDKWLGDYLFWHYIDQAKELGQHAELLKVRGIGNSFKMGAIGPRNALFFKNSKTFYVASDMQYLTKDGVISKAWDYLDFLGQNTPFPRLRLKDTQLEKKIGYKDIRSGTDKGMKGEIIGISTKDDPDKIRGKRGDILFEEYGAYPHIKKAWAVSRASVEDGDNVFAQLIAGGCVCAGTKVYTKNGDVKNIEDVSIDDGIVGYDFDSETVVSQNISYIQPITQKECIKICTASRSIECSIDHPILIRRSKTMYGEIIDGEKKTTKNGKDYFYPKKRRYEEYYKEWITAREIKEGDVILIANGIDFWGEEKLFDPRLVGMLIGDGSYGMRMHYGKPEFKTPMFSNCDSELIAYVTNSYDTSIEKSYTTKDGRKYCEIRIRDMVQRLKDVGIAGQSKNLKLLPPNYMRLTKDDSAKLLAGLFDTDGCVTIGGKKTGPCVSITQYSEPMLWQIKELLEKFGIVSSIRKREPRISPTRKDKNAYFTLDIRTIESITNFKKNIPIMIGYKIDNLNYIVEELFSNLHRTGNRINNTIEERVSKVESIGIRDIYNLTADESHTYIANGIITHNTGGTIGADFEGAEDMFYYPESYNIMSLANVYDRNINGDSKCGFFWGAYLNRSNCSNEDGMPDVTRAIKELYIELDRIRKSSSDPMALTQRKAEYPCLVADTIISNQSIGSDELFNFTNKFNNGIRPVYSLKTKGGRELQCTEEHRIFNGDDYFEAKEYASPNKLKLKKFIPNDEYQSIDINGRFNFDGYSVKIDEDWGRFIGFYMGDGCFYDSTLSIVFDNKDVESIEWTKKFFTDKFGRYCEKKHGESKCTELLVHSVYLKDFMIQMDLIYRVEDHKHGYKRNVHVPNYIMKSPKSVIKEFLSGYFDADSGVYSSIKNIRIFSIKEKHLQQVQILLSAFDIFCKIGNQIKKTETQIHLGKTITLRSWEVDRFKDIGYVSQRKQDLLDNWTKYKSKTPMDYDYDESVSFDYVGELPVYDIQTEEGCYSANGIWAHNCTPQDSMMRVDGTIFPVADIREYLETIMPKLDEFIGPHYIGDLVFDTDGKVQWRVNGHIKPIREFPLKDNKCVGAIEIFERPFLVNGEPQRGRYVAGCDPYDDDSSNTVSLGSILILDLFTDRIVAEYTGRPKFANDFYEICRRMLLYYNAVCNYENDRKGLFQYFDRKNSLHLLSDTLQSLKDVEMVHGNLMGNKAKGTNSGRFINARGRRLLADWMMTDAYGAKEEGKTILNLHKIRSIGLLLEAMKYNQNGNFDRISCGGMLMLIREDRQKFIENVMNSENKPMNGLQFDSYFLKNSKGTLRIGKEYYQ